jgi:uncharacterized protein with NRDE domain
MCLILFAYKAHPNYKLVVAANRDEFYERPTLPVDFWEDHKNILAGRDLEAGGTWMGINNLGNLCMLTNYRDLKNLKSNAPSRGKLVSDYLISHPHPRSYFETLDLLADKYNGYNIILGNHEDIWYYSNIQRKIYMLGSGVYGLSNGLLDTPWPKLVRGKDKLKKVLEKKIIQPEDLFFSLYDDTLAPDNELPDTGLSLEKERMLSSMFIKSPNYGTRCSTVLMVDQMNNLTYVERTYNTESFESSTRSFNLKVSSEKVR